MVCALFPQVIKLKNKRKLKFLAQKPAEIVPPGGCQLFTAVFPAMAMAGSCLLGPRLGCSALLPALRKTQPFSSQDGFSRLSKLEL